MTTTPVRPVITTLAPVSAQKVAAEHAAVRYGDDRALSTVLAALGIEVAS